eukprot:TRINITY_DN7487_c0_g3_i3.p1 TRINITY_DN7487_c0_g3~~TRINITY_DN7487_c0_g3_i3.p1  ORF type:complete len:147 (+),score=14.13 TRINITY_DN7487_c0_g3_i3:581-1021(+)
MSSGRLSLPVVCTTFYAPASPYYIGFHAPSIVTYPVVFAHIILDILKTDFLFSSRLFSLGATPVQQCLSSAVIIRCLATFFRPLFTMPSLFSYYSLHVFTTVCLCSNISIMSSPTATSLISYCTASSFSPHLSSSLHHRVVAPSCK